MAEILICYTLLCTRIRLHIRKINRRRRRHIIRTSQPSTLTYDEWHLCFYYDLSEYYDGVTKLGNNIQNLLSICSEPLMTIDHVVAGRLCTTILNQFDAHYATLQAMKTFRVYEKRTKGELVGGLMSAVFGVMDKDQGR